MIELQNICKIYPPQSAQELIYLYSPHGYVVSDDGTTYALLHRHFHGVVLAFLYPKLFDQYISDRTNEKLTIPDSIFDVNVFDFQGFEMSLNNKLPILRVCPSRLMGPPSIDLPVGGKCTEPQLKALRAIGDAMGVSRSTMVSTDHRDMAWHSMLKIATSGWRNDKG